MIALVHAAPQSIDDGRYYPTDEGRYIPDNSGAYIEDGRYDNGRYIPDNSGAYTEDPRVYDRLSSAGSASGGYRGSATNAAGSVFAPGAIAGSGVVSTGTAAPPAYNAAPQYATPAAYNNNRFFRILRQDQQLDEDGYYYL